MGGQPLGSCDGGHFTRFENLFQSFPKTEIAKDVDGDAVVTYSVGIDGNPLEISQPLTLHIIAGSTPGEDAAKAINARYRDTRDSCSGDTPAYYCDGVVIRATENGNFDPWDPSPSAVKLGGVSFSYMRVDAHVDSLYHNSGFIFFDQNSAIAQQKAPVYLCIYAYDAGTIVGVRSNSGCGLKPRSVPAADLSSCSSVNVRTVEQWYTYTQTLLNRDYQCSLSTADAVQFATSYQVRAKRPPNMEALWNEIMITTWPQDYGASLPIEAFFYKTSASAGLAEAKAYQTKFKNKTGRWVPIVRLNLAQLNGEPFSYAATDQAAQP
ncbi:hypothetical protein QN408_24915, partial [Pseudomonas sp. CCI4.2]|nr:hypothetical protein [Pseudomonas sp. CCI4.2]